MTLLSIGIGSLFRTAVTAMVDSMGTTFPKAAVAALEDETQSKTSLARQCLVDEGPEVFWKTIVGSLFVKGLRIVSPDCPEQFANLPGEMLGAGLHWWSASHQCKDTETQRAINEKDGKEPGTTEKFFNTFVTTPINWFLKIVGLGEKGKDENVSFLKFGLIQAGLLAGGAYILKGAEEENIPGMNLDYEDPWYISLSKTLGYTVFEQCAHLTSQTMRYYMNYKKEFGKKGGEFKDILAKALANVINERAIPGNIPSAISGCLSTLFLGRYIPKSLAGALGEAPMKGLERLLTLHRRRSTKHRYDENSPTKRVDNFRGHDNESFRNILSTADSIFNPVRNFLIEKVIARIFKPENMDVKDYVKELKDSHDMDLSSLKEKAEKQSGTHAAESYITQAT